MKRIKNAIKVFILALKTPEIFDKKVFFTLSSIYKLILLVGKEKRPYITKLCTVANNEPVELVSIWAGYGEAASPIKRIEELIQENEKLKEDQKNKFPATWIKYDRSNMGNRPTESGKYFVHRKDGKIHWETWNGCGFAYNDNVITHFLKIYKPNGNESSND